jgi:class 3 adenylate cyclase
MSSFNDLPSDTVTFLFTDIEGSTTPMLCARLLLRHDTLIRSVITARNGFIFKTMGDAFCAALGVESTDRAEARCCGRRLGNYRIARGELV